MPEEAPPFWKRLFEFVKYLAALVIRIEYHTEDRFDDDSASVDNESPVSPSSCKTYDKVFITDSQYAFQWASKDTYGFRLLKFLSKYRYFRYHLNASEFLNPVWEYVLWANAVTGENEPIEVTDTLILHCESVESYRKVIPHIRGSYSILILEGHICWFQVEQLIHPGVKRVHLDATLDLGPVFYDHVVIFIMNFCRGSEYKFGITHKIGRHFKRYLLDSFRSHKSHTFLSSGLAGYHAVDFGSNTLHIVQLFAISSSVICIFLWYVSKQS
uniref:Endoplasmic reticulum-Golgi intermediate compartment protein 2 n=1 Tax=Panagrellus redivivus TaxID=6233 RepID=A0A7E4V474_PANRE